MLFTKSILKEPEVRDGIRISIMSRHTLTDGLTPDVRIKSYDIHIPALGPSSTLIGSYYKRNLSWDDFEKQYLLEMQDEKASTLIRWIATLAKERDVTLLCIEDTCEQCHRRLLAEMLSGLGVQIEHR